MLNHYFSCSNSVGTINQYNWPVISAICLQINTQLMIKYIIHLLVITAKSLVLKAEFLCQYISPLIYAAFYCWTDNSGLVWQLLPPISISPCTGWRGHWASVYPLESQATLGQYVSIRGAVKNHILHKSLITPTLAWKPALIGSRVYVDTVGIHHS